MRVGIIGCGLIGQKRAKTLGNCQLVICADTIFERAQSLARNYTDVEAVIDWTKVIKRSDVDIVIVSTIHSILAEITLAAVEAGKRVLVEKPAARKAKELDSIIVAAEKNKVLVQVGFNHRYHRTFIKAREIIESGMIGQLLYIRGRYGHGGRIGYEKEWRAQPELSGGGELIDQGIHLIDLASYFLGNFVEVQGFVKTYFWDMPVEDNGFLLLKTRDDKIAFLHASCTEWKNLFSFEIFGMCGKIEITGLGGSYGIEKITLFKMLPGMGPPETTIWEYPMDDNSWELEFVEFVKDIRLKRQPINSSLYNAQNALRIIETVYKRRK